MRRVLWNGWIFVCAFLLCFPGKVLSQPYNVDVRVDIPGQGSVRGSSGQSTWSNAIFYQFRGVPYAETTGGRNRFKPPIPKQRWPDVLDGTIERHGCPSVAYSHGSYGIDIEDCLHLSIYTRDLHASTPVMVVLNGEMYFDTTRARTLPNYLMEKNIVLVVPQFRTGILGFLSTKTADIPGNAGVYDAAQALLWVSKFIRYFGGDPSRVTLVGQSAGAVIAHVLSISPKIAPGLFHQLILQSGTAISPIVIRKEPLKYARNLAQFMLCPDDSDLMAINKCLIDMPVRNLTEMSAIMMILYDDETPDNIGVKLTIGDPNGLLPDKPSQLIKTSPKYPLLTGTTAHDGMFAFDDEYMVMVYTERKKKSKYIAYNLLDDMLERFGIEDTTGALKGLLRQKLISQYYLSEADFFHLIPDLVDMAGIITMKIPVLRTAQINAKDQPHSTFLYSFNYKGQYTRFGYSDNKNNTPYDGGVCHNDENIYLFPYPEFDGAVLNEADTKMAQTVVDLWTSFAETGVPSSSGFPKWQPITKRNGPYVRINKRSWMDPDFTTDFYKATSDVRAGGGILRPENQNKLFQIEYVRG